MPAHHPIVIDDRMFLTPSMIAVAADIRSRLKDEFALAERLNVLANTYLAQLEVSRDDLRQMLVACLLPKSLSAFQAVLLLAERGMRSEVVILLRSSLEVLFRLSAVVSDEETAKKYVRADEVRRLRMIKKLDQLSSHVKANAIGSASLDELRDEIAAAAQPEWKEHDTRWYAERAGMLDMYHSAYAVFSETVHANVRDIEHALVITETGAVTGIRYGPDESGLSTALMASTECTILCLRGSFQVLPGPDAELEVIHEAFRQLYDDDKERRS